MDGNSILLFKREFRILHSILERFSQFLMQCRPTLKIFRFFRQTHVILILCTFQSVPNPCICSKISSHSKITWRISIFAFFLCISLLRMEFQFLFDLTPVKNVDFCLLIWWRFQVEMKKKNVVKVIGK